MRLFVALRPPAEAVAHLLAAVPPGASPSERWHVTLAFLGEVNDPAPLTGPLARAASQAYPLSLALRGSGTFGRLGPVWVGVDGDREGLRALAAVVARACRQAGVALDERAYRPHLSVGRGRRPDPAALASYAGPSWVASEMELVRSTLGATAEHRVLERYPLGHRASG